MDLIVKPTVACNFKCTFCSSTYLSEDPKDIVELDQIERFIQRFPDTNTIIVNGGDPLMMPPQYYWDMIAILDRNNCDASISFTSNLWAFYKKPEMWEELFKHERLGITTSFQYGDKRLKGDGTPFTEEDFRKVSDLFFERIGYRLDFIAVIDKDNEHTVLDTVRLAKEMGVEAKVNHVVASGPEVNNRGTVMGSENNFFTQADIYGHYIQIYEAGLMEWEYNTKQMAKRLKGKHTTCPLARNCDEGIRTLQPGGHYFSCGAFADDMAFPIDFETEMSGKELVLPLRDQEHLQSMKESCYICPMFAICNGCRKTISDTKRFGLTEHHCRKMKSQAAKIIEINGMSAHLTPTPYEDESVQLIAKG
ncbi:radical SAM protein [Pseudomonas phage pPa_SNUABM_DT01]|nr:radical SAM protein [Pseudomonas phage pPa_SNUABM_DT01]